MKRLLLVGLSLSLLATAACSDANAETKNPVVVVDTSMGKFKVELYPDKAPITVKNFLRLRGREALRWHRSFTASFPPS